MVILEPPGTYSVKLTVNGRDFTQPLTVIKDPHSGGTEADIAAQNTLLLDIRREMDQQLAPYRRKMSSAQLAQLERQYMQKRLWERYNLPRLSLFYLT